MPDESVHPRHRRQHRARATATSTTSTPRSRPTTCWRTRHSTTAARARRLGRRRIADKDPRLTLGDEKMPLSPRNANTMWMLHFLHHLKDGGHGRLRDGDRRTVNSETRSAGSADRRLSSRITWTASSSSRGSCSPTRRFPAPCGSCRRTETGRRGYRKRKGEVLFIDGRKLGTLIPGVAEAEATSDEEIERMASVYRRFA